ncbi:MAG: hypothetical protein JKX84_07650, partial [Flavobacteriales bacterium]|nr:hypothetical protein [Flavobacteriales bacterium]
MFLERSGFTYSFLDREAFRQAHGQQKPAPEHIKGHAFRMTFTNAAIPKVSGTNSSSDYRNYFIGNDRSKWKSHVRGYGTVRYTSIYDGVDMRMYSKNGNLKYDLIVNPNTDPSIIKMTYDGLDGMKILRNGDLELRTSLGIIRESKPIAFQLIDGIRRSVPCKFKLFEKSVSFIFPKGYDPNYQLTIDPELVFSTYVGSSADNFGSSATYDSSGHLYGGANVFGVGYPTTTGAFMVQFGG